MNQDGIARAHGIVEWSALGIELLATALIVSAIVVSTSIHLYGLASNARFGHAHYESYKHRLGRALLLCLEIMVAADIVRTVALDATMASVLSLGVLVAFRILSIRRRVTSDSVALPTQTGTSGSNTRVRSLADSG